MPKWLTLTSIVIASLVLTGCTWFKPKKAGLQIITNSVPASVFVDGQFMEKTPYIGKEFKPGMYSVKITPDNPELVPYETSLTLNEGLLTVVTWKPGERPETSGGVIYEMEKLGSTKQSELSIISLPDGAIVSIDDQPKEFTPIVISDVSPGQHQFEVSLPSYETQRHTINVIEGHRMNITVKLAKQVQDPTPSPEPELTTEETASASAVLGAVETATPSGNVATASGQPLRTSAAAIETPYVTIEPTNFYQNGEEVLRVRTQASSAAAEAGFAKVGSKYKYLNETDNGWFKIEFEGKVGWVSGEFSNLTE